MSYCSQCGRPLGPDSRFCVGCGASAAGGPAPAPIHSLNPSMPDQQRIVDNDQLRLVSMFHFLYAGLAGAGFMFLCAHFVFMRWILRHASEWGHGTPSNVPPEGVFHLMGFIYFFGGVLLLAGFFLNLLSASFLRQRTHRAFSLFVAGVNCLHIPFGTALGVFSIMTLTRDSVRRTYEGPRA